MAASDKEISIKVTVDSKGAVTAFQQVEGLAQTTGRNMQQSQTSAVNAIQGSYTELLSKIQLVKEAYNVLSGAVGIAFDAIQQGAKIADVSEAFAKLSEKAGSTADVFLNQLNQATGETISNFDLMRKANESLRAGIKPDEFIVLTQAARALSEETGQNLTESIDEVTRAFESGRVQMLKNRLGVIDVEAAENKLAAQLGVTREQLSKEGQVLAARTALLDASKQKTAEFGKITNDAGDNIDRFGKLLDDQKAKFLTAIANNEDLTRALSELGDVLKEIDFSAFIEGISRAITATITFTKNLTTGLKFVGNYLSELAKGKTILSAYQNAMQLSVNELLKQNQATKKSSDSLADLAVFIGKTKTGTTELTRAISDNIQSNQRLISNTPKKAIEETSKAAQDLKTNLDKVSQTVIFGPGNDMGLAEFKEQLNNSAGGKNDSKGITGLADAFFDFEDADTESLANSIASTFADAFAQVGQKMLNGEVIHREDWANITSGITSGIADSIVPGSGPLVDLATDFVFSLFGSENAGTTARKEADKFFADIFEANRLSVIINGELTRIKDLTFGEGSTFGSGEAFGLFESLPDEARAAFSGVGYAFEELLGVSEDIGGQIAAVFANNIGGSLNNLQLLVATTSKSFEDLSKLVVDSFLKGQISFVEAQTALTGIQKLAEKGIPDGIGLTVEAFNNLKAAGEKGGAVAIDALKDLASEAKELGLHTLPDLNANLAASGRFTSDELQKLFAALNTFGIKSLDELENVSNETAIAIGANLQVNEFPFEEALNSIAEIRNEIDKIPQNVKRTLTFDVKVNSSAQDRQILQQAQVGQGLGVA